MKENTNKFLPVDNRPPYDVKMIRAFLEHFMWELRIKHFEVTHAPGTTNPEFIEQLKNCYHKYGTCGLLAIDTIDPEGLPADQVQIANDYYREVTAKATQSAITALEYLDDFLEEALEGASRPTQIKQCEYGAKALLQAAESDET